ncbi:MAG: metal ABC transporter substrate-binding protein [Acidimicrobiales bacterium]|jgi:zinc/manganese transport system substrate-binding protein|nr:metal ABC transporter substrate-binding protein [Acidimicrobiales bacterium]
MRRLHPTLVTILALLTLATAACADDDDAADGPDTTAPTITVVATTSILGDIVANTLGDEATVEVLIPNGTDPHEFEPSAQEAAGLREVDLVVANGVGLEEGLADTLDVVEQEGVPVLRVGDQLAPMPLGDEPDVADPHVWMDVDRMSQAASLVAEEVGTLPGVDAAALDASLRAYQDELAATDEEVQATLAGLPDERRVLVTNHEALGYFADRYGFEVVGVIIPGGSTLAEPSAAELDELAQVIVERDVPAIFGETTSSGELAEALADEVGGDVAVVSLYTEALGDPGSGADSYTGLLTTNARLIADALGG